MIKEWKLLVLCPLFLVTVSILANDKVRIEPSISFPMMQLLLQIFTSRIRCSIGLGPQIKNPRLGLYLSLNLPSLYNLLTSPVNSISQIHPESRYFCPPLPTTPESRPPHCPDYINSVFLRGPASPTIYLQLEDAYDLPEVWIWPCSSHKCSSSWVWCHFLAPLLIPHSDPSPCQTVSPHSSLACHLLKKVNWIWSRYPSSVKIKCINSSTQSLSQLLANSRRSINVTSCYCFDHCCSRRDSNGACLGD